MTETRVLNLDRKVVKVLPTLDSHDRLKSRGRGSVSLPALPPMSSPAKLSFTNRLHESIIERAKKKTETRSRSVMKKLEAKDDSDDSEIDTQLENCGGDDEEKQQVRQLGSQEYEMALCGPEGMRKFRDVYMRRKRIEEEFGMQRQKNVPAVYAYLSKMEKMKMTPRAFGLVKASGPRAEINMRDFAMGDKYAAAFSAAMCKLTQIESVDLANNRLSNKGATELLESAPRQLKRVDLSTNNISLPTYKAISALILDPGRGLREIVLDNNRAGDAGASVLAKALDSTYTVSFLSLSKNEITDQGAKALADMLTYNVSLSVLFLHWNNIKGKGAVALAEVLADNDKLMVFDSSFNSFGTAENNSSAKAWAKLFSINKTLVHVDLSHNGFKAADCRIIGTLGDPNRDFRRGFEGEPLGIGSAHVRKRGKCRRAGLSRPQDREEPGIVARFHPN